MIFDWFINKTPKKEIYDDIKEKIKEILFPPLSLKEKDGMQYHIDYSIDSNLESALTDLQEGLNDEVTRETIKLSIEKLIKIRKLLGANIQELKSQYVIIDGGEREGIDIEQITPIEEGEY